MLGGIKTWLAKWVSQLNIDHVVWVGDCTLWDFVLSHEYFIPTGHCKCFSEVVCSARQQYRDYIINLYSVKYSTVSNTKYAMPSLYILSPFFLYNPYIPHFLIQKIVHFLVSLLLLCMNA